MSTKFCYQPVFDFNNNSVLEDKFYADVNEEDVQLLHNEINVKVEPTAAMAQSQHNNHNASNNIAPDPFLSSTVKYNQVYGRYTSEALSSPTNRKKTGGRKERTPRTLLKLMERHRHNERVRHHTLNERLRVICQFVPGSGEDGRETKVVMMQRIISYIAYLENTICQIRSQLGLTAEQCFTPLTIQLRKQIDEFAKLAVVPNMDEATESKRPRIEPKKETPRRYKISSPTIDSTTDKPFYTKSYYHNSQESSQDSMAPTSSFYSMNSDNSLPHWLEDPMLHANDDFESMFEPPVLEKTNHLQPIITSDSFSKVNDVTMSEYYFEPIQESFTTLSQPTSDSSKQSDNTNPDILSESMQQVFGLNSTNETDPDFLTSMVVLPDKVLSISQVAPPSQEEFLSSQDTHTSQEQINDEVPINSSSFLTNDHPPSIMMSTEQESQIYPEGGAIDEIHEDNSAYEHPTLIANHEETVTSYEVNNTPGQTEENQIFRQEERIHCIEDVTSSFWSPLHRNKRKQYTPTKHEQLTNMTNYFSTPDDSNDGTSIYETPINFTSMLNSCHRYTKPEQSMNSHLDVNNNDDVSPTKKSFKTCATSNSLVKSTEAKEATRIEDLIIERESSSVNKEIQASPTKTFINIQTKPQEMSGDGSLTITNSLVTENQNALHQVPYSWTFHSMNDTVGKKYNSTSPQTKIKIHRPQAPQLKENLPPITNTKLDLRKTSWMNGFMMFSRLNRKNFISANPGVHTSHISKLMGQSWRNMSDAAQQPYKDKAQLFLSDSFLGNDEEEKEKKSNFINIVKMCGSSKPDGECQPLPVVSLPNVSSRSIPTSSASFKPISPASNTRSSAISTLKPLATAIRPVASSSNFISTSSSIRPVTESLPIYNSQRWMYL